MVTLPYRDAWPADAPKPPALLRGVLDDIQTRLGAGSTGGGSSFDLDFSGVGDNRAALEAQIAAEILAGRDHMIVAPPTGTTAPTLYFDGLVRIENYARPFTLEFRRTALRYGPNAELRSQGREVEGPAEGKAKLFANVDATGGAVVAFDVDVTPNPAIVAAMVPGARIRIRGQNDAVGDVLNGHRHETTVVSFVQVVLNQRYTLTISTPLPTTVPANLWERDWDGSAWTVAVGGPNVDSTLISVLTEMLLDVEIADTAEIPVPSGFDAVAAFPVGSWVVVQSDARTQNLVTGGGSNELVNRLMFQVMGHLTGPDRVLLDLPFPGTLHLTLNATTMRPRVSLVQPSLEPTVIFDPAYPVEVVGTVAPPPASRRHVVNHRYAIRPKTRGVVLRGDDNASDVHGALVREHICVAGYHSYCVRMDAKHRATGGSGNGIWLKNSRGSIVERCVFVRVRHGVTPGGGMAVIARENVLHDCYESAIDTGHGEMGHYNAAIGNHVFGGRAAADRSAIKGIEASNNSSLAGDEGSVIQDNHFWGFDGGTAIVLRSGSRGTRIDGNVIHGPCAVGVSIVVDRRAPSQGMSDIRIDGDMGACTVGVLIDGRPPAWVSGAEILGTAARPTFLEDSTRSRLYSTTGTGLLGGTNPSHTSGSAANGAVTLTYVGLVAAQPVPIDGVKVQADLDGAATGVEQYRASDVTIGVGLGDVTVQDLREWGSGAAVTVSSAAGVIEPVWPTHFDNSQTVHLLRGVGDVTAGPLLARFPPFVGAGRAVRTVQYEAMVATMATAPIEVAGCTYVNTDGAAVITAPAGTVAALKLEVGDPIIGADFTGAAVASIAGDVITATVAAAQAATATISFTVPGSTIDGARRINMPWRASGALFGMEAKSLPTSTALGVMQTTAGAAGSGDVVGPASATADRIALFNGTTGKLIKQATLGIAGLFQKTELAAGAITAATGTVNLTGTNGQVLTIDGSGNVSFGNALGNAATEITATENPVVDAVAIPLTLSPTNLGSWAFDSTSALTGHLEVDFSAAVGTERQGPLLAVHRSGANGAFEFRIGDVDGSNTVVLTAGQSFLGYFDGTILRQLKPQGVGDGGGGLSSVTHSTVNITASGNVTSAMLLLQASGGALVERYNLIKPATGSATVALTIPDNLAIGSYAFARDPSHTGVWTVANQSAAGSINGASGATVTVTAEPGALVWVHVRQQPGSAAEVWIEGDILGPTKLYGELDGQNNVITSVLAKIHPAVSSGTIPTSYSGGGCEITGNVTIPGVAGFNGTFKIRGTHTLTFNALTSGSLASGDTVNVFVWGTTEADIVKASTADRVALS